MKPTLSRPDLLLVLARTNQHAMAELVGTVSYRYDPALDTDRHGAEAGTVLRPQFTNPASRYSEFAELYVRTALDVNGYAEAGAYCWTYQYRPGIVHLPLAQSMTAVLQHLDRQMSTLARQVGAPSDFAQYHTHFAAALSITVFAEDCAELQPDDTHCKWMDVDQMCAWVRQHERTTAPASARL